MCRPSWGALCFLTSPQCISCCISPSPLDGFRHVSRRRSATCRRGRDQAVPPGPSSGLKTSRGRVGPTSETSQEECGSSNGSRRLQGRILVHSYRKDAVINTICRGQEVRTWEQLPVLLPHDILKPDFLSWWYISDLEQSSDCSVFFLEGRNLCPDSQQRFKLFTFLQPRPTQVLWKLIPPLEAAQPAELGILKLLCGLFFMWPFKLRTRADILRQFQDFGGSISPESWRVHPIRRNKEVLRVQNQMSSFCSPRNEGTTKPNAWCPVESKNARANTLQCQKTRANSENLFNNQTTFWTQMLCKHFPREKRANTQTMKSQNTQNAQFQSP